MYMLSKCARYIPMLYTRPRVHIKYVYYNIIYGRLARTGVQLR